MGADPKFNCVEDIDHNRITSKDEGRSIIHIPKPIEGRDSYRIGRWIRKHEFLPPRPLFTRYEPLKCRVSPMPQEGSPLQMYCSSIAERDNDGTKRGKNLSGLYEYEFQWNMKASEEELVEQLRQRKLANNMPKICAVGDSHSNFMVTQSLPALNLTGLFDYYVQAFFPAPGLIASTLKKHNYDCDVFFVQVNQWLASFLSGGEPFSLAKYHQVLKEHVQNILKFNPNARVYLPTADQAPLGPKFSNCKDWKAPTLIDSYSYVHQMVVKELDTFQVKYLDTRFIIGPHWDGHPDWHHLMELTRSRKTIYMSAIMSGETEWFE